MKRTKKILFDIRIRQEKLDEKLEKKHRIKRMLNRKNF